MEDLAASPRLFQMRRTVRAWLPVAVYCAAIFVASCIPGSAVDTGPDLPSDKAIHFLMYAGLGALLVRALTLAAPGRRPLVTYVFAVALGLAYGVSDELHQILTPGRDADIADVVADLLGCASGAALARVFYARKRE